MRSPMTGIMRSTGVLTIPHSSTKTGLKESLCLTVIAALPPDVSMSDAAKGSVAKIGGSQR